jgi:hypothetical protein
VLPQPSQFGSSSAGFVMDTTLGKAALQNGLQAAHDFRE